jgi:hypothetical protein
VCVCVCVCVFVYLWTYVTPNESCMLGFCQRFPALFGMTVGYDARKWAPPGSPERNCQEFGLSKNVRTEKECRAITHRVQDGYQNRGSPLHQKQEISDTARCLETALYVLTFCDFIFTCILILIWIILVIILYISWCNVYMFTTYRHMIRCLCHYNIIAARWWLQ